MTDNSPMTELAERARAVMPAGGFGNFEPGFFVKSGAGSRVIDENGKEYVDYMISSGPMILGHGHEEVNAAVREQLFERQRERSLETGGAWGGVLRKYLHFHTPDAGSPFVNRLVALHMLRRRWHRPAGKPHLSYMAYL
ncbi:MAG: aminotransferase class III-fold pyridoxal phosphate-dependent enzyme, partial [Pseudomonadota bacterium]|nr:aminotransferase class III-fold pyridoxal phosphate-dependent enzyme [Pseudomonadota bacterium]